MTRAMGTAVGGLLVVACWHAAHAQVPTVSGDPLEYLDASRRADELLTARDYAGAAATLTTLAEAGSLDANVWARLGIARYRTGDYEPAIVALERALTLGGMFEQHSSAYVARAHAQLGQVAEAVRWIERTLMRERLENRDAFIADSAFDRIRSDPRFVAATRKSTATCAPGAAGWRTDLDYLLAEVRRLNSRYSREPFPK